jgi:arylsulfatase A-like enzyme
MRQIMAGLGLTAKQIDRRVHTIDIAPTLSAYMGIKPPSGAQGNPLVEVLK